MTRRRVVAAGALLMPGLLLPGCGRKRAPAGVRSPTELGTRVQGDIEVLNAALAVEALNVRALAPLVARSGHRAQPLAARMQQQDREHVARLREAIERLGGTPAPIDTAAERARADPLARATAVKRNAIAAYVDLLPKLGDQALRGTVAAIVAAEAEHLAVVSGIHGLPEVPQAFVVGAKAP